MRCSRLCFVVAVAALLAQVSCAGSDGDNDPETDHDGSATTTLSVPTTEVGPLSGADQTEERPRQDTSGAPASATRCSAIATGDDRVRDAAAKQMLERTNNPEEGFPSALSGIGYVCRKPQYANLLPEAAWEAEWGEPPHCKPISEGSTTYACRED